MQHEEKIVVVNIDFWTLHKAGAVFNIQGVEMEVISQKIQIFNGRIRYMMPLISTEINGVNHTITSFLLMG